MIRTASGQEFAMNEIWSVRSPTVLGFAVLFATLGAAPPTMGEESAAFEPTNDAKQAAYEKKPVCRKEIRVGTRISKTVCRTAAQRDAERANSQEYLMDIQEGATIQAQSAQ
jgi:hypothetical protein